MEEKILVNGVGYQTKIKVVDDRVCLESVGLNHHIHTTSKIYFNADEVKILIARLQKAKKDLQENG